MASATRASSLLPTIKCSNCSVEIPISHMGDHICSQAPPIPEPSLQSIDGALEPSMRPKMGHASSSLRTLQISPPLSNTSSIDHSHNPQWDGYAAEIVTEDDLEPVPPKPLFSSRGPSDGPRSASPAASLDGRQSPFELPPRSATAPVPSRSQSREAMRLQDGSFPRFPNSRPQSPMITTPVERTFPRLALQEEQQAEIVYAPASPRDNGGEGLLKRMDSIAPGPFHMKKNSESRRVGHHRKSSSMTNSHDLMRSSTLSGIKAHSKRPSTSSSIYTRNPSMVSMPGAAPLAHRGSDVPALPSVPPSVDLTQSRRPSNVSSAVGDKPQFFNFGTLDDRRDSPSPNADRPQEPVQQPEQGHNAGLSISRPSGHKPQASVASIMAPLHEIGSASSFKPSKSIRGRRAAAADARRAGSVDQVGSGDAPPLPTSSLALSYDVGNPHHAPNESVSSDGSSSSGAKTGSSRSSPPLSEYPQSPKAPTDGVRVNTSFQGFQFGVEDRPNSQEPGSYHGGSIPSSPRARNGSSQPHSAFADAPHSQFDSRPGTPSSHTGPNSAPPTNPYQSSWGPSTSPFAPNNAGVEGPKSRPGTPSRPRGPPPKPMDLDFGIGLMPPNDDLGPPSGPEPLASRSPHPPSSPRVPPSPLAARTEPTSPKAYIPPRKDSIPASSPDDYVVTAFPDRPRNSLHITTNIPPPPPIPDSSSPGKRQKPQNKGPCRGCKETIYGKSVSSADGRLTGRYHKQCFVCTTCAAPFQTIDFYVCSNNPYCARHYHEVNNSICGSCDRGIEGQYLEMLEDPRERKFHPFCFTCQDCHLILRDDYYEWNGRVLCEQHAFGTAQRASPSGLQPSSLGPGRRYPEKRSTRLMMM